MNEDYIMKAGGVVTRVGEDGTEIYIVHRAEYDDWSIPKGHVEEDEEPDQAALREVREEVGFACEINGTLPDYEYQTPDGEEVTVYLFEMSVVDIHEPTDDEVDEGEWVNVEEAIDRISYPSLQEYIATNFQ